MERLKPDTRVMHADDPLKRGAIRWHRDDWCEKYPDAKGRARWLRSECEYTVDWDGDDELEPYQRTIGRYTRASDLVEDVPPDAVH